MISRAEGNSGMYGNNNYGSQEPSFRNNFSIQGDPNISIFDS